MHQHYLQQALALAKTRRGYCAPNPAVGAVVVKDKTIIGTGAHYACGMPHAEVEALKGLGAKAQGATLYVTLEPCSHYGRTPPCTKAISEAGISEVFYGYKDPNPLVADSNFIHMPLAEIDAFYRSYAHWHQTSRPWVTAKIALSLDGKIAGPQGIRVAITGPELKERTYESRKCRDAILTTAKTIIHDNPRLDIRGTESKPIYILDRNLCLTDEYQIWQNTNRLTVFYSPACRLTPYKVGNISFVPILEQDGQLDLDQVINYIGRDGVHDLWVEAGGILLESLLARNYVDTLHIYCAAKWLGLDAQSAFSTRVHLEQFTQKKWIQVGDDVVCEMERV